MTGYAIGDLDVEWAVWLNENQTLIELYTTDSQSYTMFEDSPDWGDIATSGITVRPMRQSEFHTIWNATSNQWEVNQLSFTAFLKDQLVQYRNTKIASTVSYNGIQANNTTHEHALIVSLISFLQSHNQDIELDWKQPDGTFAKAKLADFQGLVNLGGIETQKVFSSESYVLQLHASSPYESIADAFDDFDTYLNSL
ncbi:hypothetical protein GCM10027347_59120 [Larkinella harenae]